MRILVLALVLIFVFGYAAQQKTSSGTKVESYTTKIEDD